MLVSLLPVTALSSWAVRALSCRPHLSHPPASLLELPKTRYTNKHRPCQNGIVTVIRTAASQQTTATPT